MKHLRGLLVLLTIALLLGAMGVQCAGAAPVAQPTMVAGYAPAPSAGERAAVGKVNQPGIGGGEADTTLTGADGNVQPMIIKTAELSLRVPDTKTGLNDVTRLATEAGGHVSSSGTRKDGQQLVATVVIRVPATAFETVLEKLRALGDVQADSVSGQDVTGEYTDLAARLKNLEAAETELLAIMTEIREKGGKAEDVLAVYREITNIRGEIEAIKGRMKYLADQSAMSTITVYLAPQVAEVQVVPGGWYPDKTLKDAVSALVSVLQALINMSIWLVVFSVCLLPFVIVAGLVLLVVWLRRRRTRRAVPGDNH
ncbi:MAG: DUF4349 domain-containing protein [Chloroflexi bacterium]|nr:DUF4349 domain-containing protein [Chloroflexota bacterium]MBU1746068.1 DUF4349 domain-containing protein [Chloroflexota bacterium]